MTIYLEEGKKVFQAKEIECVPVGFFRETHFNLNLETTFSLYNFSLPPHPPKKRIRHLLAQVSKSLGRATASDMAEDKCSNTTMFLCVDFIFSRFSFIVGPRNST